MGIGSRNRLFQSHTSGGWYSQNLSRLFISLREQYAPKKIFSLFKCWPIHLQKASSILQQVFAESAVTDKAKFVTVRESLGTNSTCGLSPTTYANEVHWDRSVRNVTDLNNRAGRGGDVPRFHILSLRLWASN